MKGWVRTIRIRSILTMLSVFSLFGAVLMVARSYLFKEALGFQRWTLQPDVEPGTCVLRHTVFGVFWFDGRIALGHQDSVVSGVLYSQARKHGLRPPVGQRFGLITLYNGEHALLGHDPRDGTITPLGLYWGDGGHSSGRVATKFSRLRIPGWLLLLLLCIYPARLAWSAGRMRGGKQGFPALTREHFGEETGE